VQLSQQKVGHVFLLSSPHSWTDFHPNAI